MVRLKKLTFLTFTNVIDLKLTESRVTLVMKIKTLDKIKRVLYIILLE